MPVDGGLVVAVGRRVAVDGPVVGRDGAVVAGRWLRVVMGSGDEVDYSLARFPAAAIKRSAVAAIAIQASRGLR